MLRLVVDHGRAGHAATAGDLRRVAQRIEVALQVGIGCAQAIVRHGHFTWIACGYIAACLVRDGISPDIIERVFGGQP